MAKSNNAENTLSIDWDSIIATIKSGKCVLLIGPEILSDAYSSFQDKLLDFLKESLSLESATHFAAYYRRHELFDFTDETEHGLVYQKLKQFYGNLEDNSLFQKLASIAIPLTISLNPDDLLCTAFKAYRHHFQFYSRKPMPDNTDEAPGLEFPWLYNLFGTLERQETLILTYDDLLNYIFSLLGKSPDLPGPIKNALGEAENFLFLGFRFEQWYMQLIVRILTMQGENKGKIKYAFDKARYQEDTFLFYTDHFKVRFLDMTPVEFIDQLYERCKAKNLLRQPLELSEQLHIREQLEKLFEDDDLEAALNVMKKYFKDQGEAAEDDYEECIVQTGRLRNLARNEREGVLTFDDVQIQRSRIRKACRELIKQLER
ncbi:MAG: SIR2 family protein [Saprospiraceae bacterium]|nr:SIR2 family protein [Saprospiraceae bacterium]